MPFNDIDDKKKISIDISSGTVIGISILTLLIFFCLLNIDNAGVRLVDLTVGDVLFAVFWIFIIDVSIIGVFIILFVIIAIASG